MTERFTTGAPRPLTFAEIPMQEAKNKRVLETNEKLADALKQLEAQKKYGEWLKQQIAERDIKPWDGIENMSLDELQQSAEMLKKLTKIIDEKVGIHSVNENHMYYRGSGVGRPMPGVNPATYGGGEGSNGGGGGRGGVMPPGKFGPKN